MSVDDPTALERHQASSLATRTEVLLGMCASPRWADAMARRLQSCATINEVLEAAGQIWRELTPQDWREALNSHPKIGARTAAGSRESREQGSMASATPAVQAAIAAGNQEYEQRFGMTYVVRATDRSPAEMLRLLRQRLDNDAETELHVAAAQQAEITRLRLIRLFNEQASA